MPVVLAVSARPEPGFFPGADRSILLLLLMIGRAMIEYRCDRCQRLIEQTTDVRYVVRIEVQAALEPLTRHLADDERDHLQEISEQLDGVDGAAAGVRPIEDSFEQSRYDLCSACFQAFRERPLGEPAEAEEASTASRRRASDLHPN